MPIIGAHVSAAGGIHNAFENAKNIGARAIQIFGSSPRQWAGVYPQREHINEFKSRLKDFDGPVFLHAPYLANLASPNAYTLKQSIECLIFHLKIAHDIGAKGVIFHPGSGKEMPKNKALLQIVQGMKKILEKTSPDTLLIIENTAGGGHKVGAILEDLSFLLKKSKNNRIRICFDTAHALESGLIKKYDRKSIKKLFDDFDTTIGLENLSVIHSNDSKTPCGSFHDRHENIGEGHIGIAGFKNLAKEKRLYKLAWILEVPGFDDTGPDKRNIELLRSCF